MTTASPRGVVKAGGERGLVAEVAGQMDHADAGVALGDVVEHERGAVGGPVVDQDELERAAPRAPRTRG